MKKRVLSILICTALVIGIVPSFLTNTFADGDTSLQVGDIIEFGSYPQSIVENEELIEQLNELPVSWNFYDYYSGTGVIGSMTKNDYMKYADVIYDGNKYRAVSFSEYRPHLTIDACSEESSYIDDNGFSTDTVYWFEYEPIQWRVLDPDNGYLLCEYIVDCQPISNTVYQKSNDTKYYCDSDFTIGLTASHELIDWINTVFKSTSFESEEQSIIISMNLLTKKESLNDSYGFNPSDKSTVSRATSGTDYARIQGLYDDYWWLSDYNSTFGSSSYASIHLSCGDKYVTSNKAYSLQGVRMVMKLSDISSFSRIGSILPWTDVSVPQLKIGEDNYWYISYDEGMNWISLDVKATGENGVGIDSVYINDDGELIVILTNGNDFNLGIIKGEDGVNGDNGKDGATISSAYYNNKGELVIIMTDGTEINAGKPSGSAFDINMDKPVVTISGYQASRGIDYGSTITFHSSADFVPEGYQLHWFVNGEDAGTSQTLTITNVSSDFTVNARLMKNGSTISESKVEKVTVKNDFFSRLIAMFKKLFNADAFIIDQQ